MNLNEYMILSCWLSELMKEWKKLNEQLQYDKPLIQLTITRAIDSTYPSWDEMYQTEILAEQLGSCLFVNAWWVVGGNASQLSDILICKSTGFFFQHDNKSLLLLHFWLLMLCDLLISTVRNILDWVLESLLFCQHFCILNFVISQTHSLDYELTFDLNLPDTYGWWSTLQKGQSESAKMCQSDSEQWTFPLDISTIYINLTSDFHEKTIFLWSFRSQNIYMSL